MEHLKCMLLFVVYLSIVSCQQKENKETLVVERVEINFNVASFDNYKNLAVVKSTQIIPLSEDIKQDLVIGQIDKVIVLDSLIYIADTYMKRLLVYDMQGQIVGRVGSIGGGPGEYTSLSDFCVGDKGEIYLYDSGSNKMLEYDRNLKFVDSSPISFKAEQFHLIGSDFLFGLAPYNNENRTLGKMTVLTDRSFTPITSALAHSDAVDHNYEFLSPMTPCKDGTLYNRVIDNNVYLFDKEGTISQSFHFDFGSLTISADDLKDINALMESHKEYCYVALPPVVVGDLLMGVLNKTGEMFTFVYDRNLKALSLKALTEFALGEINLPLTTCANGSQLVSYFNKDIYPEFKNSDQLSPEIKKVIEQGGLVLCINSFNFSHK